MLHCCIRKCGQDVLCRDELQVNSSGNVVFLGVSNGSNYGWMYTSLMAGRHAVSLGVRRRGGVQVTLFRDISLLLPIATRIYRNVNLYWLVFQLFF